MEVDGGAGLNDPAGSDEEGVDGGAGGFLRGERRHGGSWTRERMERRGRVAIVVLK